MHVHAVLCGVKAVNEDLRSHQGSVGDGGLASSSHTHMHHKSMYLSHFYPLMPILVIVMLMVIHCHFALFHILSQSYRTTNVHDTGQETF